LSDELKCDNSIEREDRIGGGKNGFNLKIGENISGASRISLQSGLSFDNKRSLCIWSDENESDQHD
jgi:hypothetical protein